MIDASGSIHVQDMAALKTLIRKVTSKFVISADGEFSYCSVLLKIKTFLLYSFFTF